MGSITDKRLRKASAAERLMGPPVNQDEESFDASSRPETVTASLPGMLDGNESRERNPTRR